MNIQVRYASRGGNTKKVAEAMGRSLGAQVFSAEEPLSAPVDLLIVGSGVYAGQVHTQMKALLSSLTADKVKSVAVFTTAGNPKSILPQVKEIVAGKDIAVLDNEFHCPGRFLLMNRGRPNEQDLEAAGKFAASLRESALKSQK